jgi:hypothetical protein
MYPPLARPAASVSRNKQWIEQLPFGVGQVGRTGTADSGHGNLRMHAEDVPDDYPYRFSRAPSPFAKQFLSGRESGQGNKAQTPSR